MNLQIYAYINLWTSVACIALAFLLLAGGGLRKKANISFSVMSLITAAWQFGLYKHTLSTTYNGAMYWSIVLHGFAILIPPFYMLFVMSMLGISRRYFTGIMFALALLLVYLNIFSRDFIATVSPISGFAFFPMAGKYYVFYLAEYFICFLLPIYWLAINIKNENGNKKDRLILLFVSTVIGVIGSSSTFLPVYGIPIFPYANCFTWLFTMVLAYAITKTKFLDISVIVSKSIAYGTAMLILGISYIALVTSYRMFISQNIDIGFVSMTIAYGIFVGFAFERMRMFIQTSSDKLFLQGRFDLAKTSADVAERLSSIVSLDALSSALESIRVNNIESTLLELHLLEGYPSNESVKSNIAHLSNDPLKEYFFANKLIAEISRLPKGLKETLQKNVEYIAPSYSADKLIALLYIGRKLSENTYSSDEIAVFKVLAPQIATVIERIKPFEKIKHDFDSTQKKLFETEKMLGRSARLASLGTLTAGVTHEIRNPLGVIRMGMNLMAKEPRDAKYLQEWRDLHIKHVDRIADIIDKMLHLSKAKEAVNRVFNVNDLIKQYIIGIVSSKNVNISTDLKPVPDISAIEDDLHQVLINLTSNAIKAMPDGGNLMLKTYETNENGSAKVVIEVSDTGTGITPENLEKIFDPFFSTWENGTGLGLSISYKIIEELKGRIEVQSQVGKGSIFKIILPAV
ncbi:MAG: ATP-binding protein [Candidatus Margulisiibacteriota bacterium]